MKTDIDIAKAFLDKHGPVEYTESLRISNSTSGFSFNEEHETTAGEWCILHLGIANEKAIAILEKYLKDHLRDGGLKVEIIDSMIEPGKVRIRTFEDKGDIGWIRQYHGLHDSDLEALVEAYDKFMEMKK